MANFVKANDSMYQPIQQDTTSYGLGGFVQVAHMQPQQHPLLNCGSHEKSTYNVLAAHHSQLHPHSYVHHQQQLHHHQFLARHHHLTSHATVMEYHHDEKRGKRTENMPPAYFPTGIMPLNASKYSMLKTQHAFINRSL